MGALAVIAVLAILWTVALSLLHTPANQQRVLRRISARTEAAMGVVVEAAGFRLRPAAGSVRVDELVLRTADGRALATAERLNVRLRPASVLSPPLRLEEVDLDGLVVDLDQPLPAAPRATPAEEEGAAEELPLRVGRLRLRDARLVGGPVGEVLAGWSLSRIGLEAGFDGRRLTLRRLDAAAGLAPAWRDGEPVTLGLELAGRASLDRTIEIDALRLDGEVGSARLSGATGAGLEKPRAAFEIATDLGRWLTGEPAGPVRLEGQIDLAAWTGWIELAALDQPASLSSAYLSPALAESLAVGASRIDLEADLRLEDERSVGGLVRLALSRTDGPHPGAKVLEVEARPRVEIGDELPFETAVAAELLPAEAGRRRLSARLLADRSADLESWRIEDGVLAIEERDLGPALARLASLYPGLLPPATLPHLPGPGALAANGAFAGPLLDPRLELRARWSQPTGGRIEIAADGAARAGPLRIATTGRRVEIGDLTAAAAGTLDWSGVVEDALGAARGRLELTATSLAATDRPLARSVSARLEGDRRAIDWRLAADRAEGVALVASGEIEPVLPLRRASGSGRIETGDPRLPSVDASFDLAGGVLLAHAELAVTGRDEVTVDARLPLAAFDELPAAEALAGLPLVRADGPLEIQWSAPTGSWSALVPPELAGRLERLTAGSSGRLLLDPGCPACSSLESSLDGLDLVLDGRRVHASEGLALTLADGRLRAGPMALAGDGLTVTLDADLGLDTAWRFGDPLADLGTDLDARFESELDSVWLESLPLEVTRRGVVTVAGAVSGALDRLAGAARLEAPALVVAADAFPDLPLGRPAASLSFADGFVGWEDFRLEAGPALLVSSGRTRLAAPLADLSGRLDVTTGLPVIERVGLPVTLRDGLLTVDGAVVQTPEGDGTLRLEAAIGDADGGGIVRAAWDLPANDWAPLLRQLGGSEDPELVAAAFRGSAEWSPQRPAGLVARAVLDRVRIVSRGRESRVEPAIELAAAEGVVRIPRFLLRSGNETFSFEASARLDPDWTPPRATAELVSDFTVNGDGQLDAGLANPFLAGGRGEGPLGLTLDLAGSPAEWSGSVRVLGPEASVLFRGTYLVRLERPDLELAIANGVATLVRGSARVNEGAASFSGIVWDGRGTDLMMRLEDARLRLDYGLLTTVGADLRLTLVEGETTLAGVVDIRRGSLTRTLRPDLDFLTGLLAPIDLSTTEESALDLLALDLEIRTREGVRIDNNLAEMLVRWEPLAVTGTAARPVIEGRLEADPGGLLFLYGQTVRLDMLAIEYPGVENAEARLDFEATTSLEDPTIGRLAGSDPFRSDRRGEPPPAADATADLARYVGESLAGRVGEAVGVNLSLRPILIFGETDPGARLTVSRDFSPYLSLAASVDLREAESQTYVLEAHELEILPQLVTQVFTDDESEYGTVLLQRQQFGGSRPAADPDRQRVRRLQVDPTPGVSKRGIRRAAGLSRGDLLDDDRRFAAEVGLVDYLRRKGYADATVAIRPLDTGPRTRLEVAIDPGPRARFVFTGEKLPKPLRVVITDLYRADFYEPESLAEMEAETVRALRSRGFLAPRVRVEVTPLDAARPGGDRQVSLHTEGGVRISPKPPVFLGLPPEDVAVLDALFFNPVQRVELAVGLPSADRRLLAALADLGYPQARIGARYESLADRVLTVEIESGPRRRITAVTLEPAADAFDLPPDLNSLLIVSAGDPLDRRALARSALAVERALGARGYRQARVQTIVESAGEDPHGAAVRFAVAPGPVSRIAEVEFSGLRSTRERWARAVADLEPGDVLARDDLANARTRLWRTGLFSAISTRTAETDPAATGVAFDLAERPRYRLAYGARWDSETGVGAVVDATDDNFRGRGWTLGLRALFSSDEKSLRWLTRVPRAFGGRGSFEIYAGASEIVESTFDRVFGRLEEVTEVLETTLQYSHPLGDATTLRLYGRYADTVSETLFVTEEITDPALGVQLLYDTRSPEPLVRRGVFASIDLSGSEDFLGGDLRYARLFSQLHVHRPVKWGGGRLTWSQSYRLGLAEAFGQELIRQVRFFAGGEYSVRGYATESLGPLGLLGPRGGAALAVINQELRWRLLDDYALLAFADAGEVWPRIGDLALDLRLAAGVGLRAVTPIGLVRLDLAHALDRRPEVDPEFKLYFGLGTVF